METDLFRYKRIDSIRPMVVNSCSSFVIPPRCSASNTNSKRIHIKPDLDDAYLLTRNSIAFQPSAANPPAFDISGMRRPTKAYPTVHS